MSIERETLNLSSLPVEERALGVEVRLNPAEEQELSNYIRSSYTEMKSDRTSLEMEWADNLQRYEAVLPKPMGPWPGSSDIRPPLSRVVTDTLCALWMNSLFGNRSKVRANPIGPDDIAKARKNEEFARYVLDNEVLFYDVMDRATAQFLGPTGNAFLEPRYVVEKELREERVMEEIEDPMDPAAPKQRVERVDEYEETVFDGVRVDLISAEHIFAPGAPYASAQEAAERDILIKLMPQTVEEIRRKAKGKRPKYHNVDLLDLLMATETKSHMTYAKEKVDHITKEYLKGRRVVNTAEAYLWWNVPGSGDQREQRIIVTLDIDTGIIFRVIKGRCRIVHIKPYPVPGRFWGRSPISIVKPIQKNIDAVVNQFIDAGTIANLPVGFYRAGGTFNPQMFSLTPAHMYPVENPGDVAWAPTPKPDNSLPVIEQLMWQYIERLFGLNEIIQGAGSRNITTATEAIEVSRRAAVKFGAPFQRTIHQLNPLLQHIHDLNYEFAPEEKTYRVIGRDGLPVFNKYTREDSKARLNYAFEVETIFDEQLARDTMLLAYRMWRTDPQVMLNRASLYRFTRDAMEAIIGDSSPYLPVPEEAKLPSAEEAIQLLLSGERVDPKPGIDAENYVRVLAAFIDSAEFQQLRNDQQRAIFAFFAKVKFMLETFEKFNLNMDGKFDGLMESMAGSLPQMSVGKNPSSTFNNVRMGPGRQGGMNAELSSQMQGIVGAR